MTTDFTTLFVNVDDCWKAFEKIYAKHLIEDGGCSLNIVCIRASLHSSRTGLEVLKQSFS